MLDLLTPSFDALIFAALSSLMLREAMIAALPNRVAGPGGWLIDTGPEA